jgi:hypothetical protein
LLTRFATLPGAIGRARVAPRAASRRPSCWPGFWLLGELKFLIPYRLILIHQYGGLIPLWVAILFVNVFAGVYAIQRKFFLKDTGRKLTHVDNQALAGHFPTSPTETQEPE